jgi:hypothetical protein
MVVTIEEKKARGRLHALYQLHTCHLAKTSQLAPTALPERLRNVGKHLDIWQVAVIGRHLYYIPFPEEVKCFTQGHTELVSSELRVSLNRLNQYL